ncbi:MAG TPA: hypothetical protein VGV88_12165 [Candidatus Dormibacteraeota bacterium]|nr:hypothetical protein [Candidatus Dormibacteraeota bacterium]
MPRGAAAAGALVLLAACGAGGFTLTGATVDSSYTCAVGSNNTSYVFNARISADNSTSKAVAVDSIDAVMVVAAVHGQWQQAVGSRYDAGKVQFLPRSVGTGSQATVTATIVSACTNGRHQGTNDNYADYSVQLTVMTSAGTFHLTSSNRHRIVAP